jgi:hypothetical protein
MVRSAALLVDLRRLEVADWLRGFGVCGCALALILARHPLPF